MLCWVGLAGTLIMGLLGREAWNDARAWRGLFQWSAVPPTGYPGSSPGAERCARGDSLACQICPAHRAVVADR